MLRLRLCSSVILSVAVLFLSGCASSVFPDFEDYDEVVVDDGGKVKFREVKEKGILVADKDNAAYEEDENEKVEPKIVKPVADAEKVEPAKVVAVKADKIEPLSEENVDVKESNETAKPEIVERNSEETAGPSMNYLAATIYFENGGATVAPSYNKVLREIAKTAKDNNATVVVYGFASSRTRDTDPASHKLANFKVSADRAANTAKALRRLGVKADRISVQAMSDSMPMYQEVMPEGERLNRRAEIYLAY